MLRSTFLCGTILALSGGLVAAQGVPETPDGIFAPYVAGDVVAEIVGELPQGIGNIAFTPAGDIIYSHHPFYGYDVRVALMDADGRGYTPWPNEAWNTPVDGSDEFLDTVLGIRGDSAGVVWMSDMMHGARRAPKLVGWNTNTDKLEAVYYFTEPAIRPCNADECSSQLNDFAIDEARGYFYFADEQIGPGGDAQNAALVVLNRETGEARRVLEGHESTLPGDVPIIVDGEPLSLPIGPNETHAPLLVGADGIVIDLDNEWVYFSPLNGGWIYRVLADDLVDEALSDAELGQRVERYAMKPANGGLSIDADDNLYFTAVEGTHVGVIPPDTRRFRPFASHPLLQWPDGVSYNPNDGHMYVGAPQLAQLGLFNNGTNYSAAPYYMFRFEPLAESAMGR